MKKVMSVELEYQGKPYIGEAFEEDGEQKEMVCYKCPSRNTVLCGSDVLRHRKSNDYTWTCSEFGSDHTPGKAMYYVIRPDVIPRKVVPLPTQSPEEIDIINQIL